MTDYNTIAELNNFIVLDEYKKYLVLREAAAVYQTESSLEREFIQDLVNQGYENLPKLTTTTMLENIREQLQILKQRVIRIETFFAISIHLIKRFSDSNPTFF